MKSEALPFCRRCKFFVTQFPDDYNGECRRHAPIAPLVIKLDTYGSEKNNAMWPNVKRDMGCGDFERKEGVDGVS